MVPAVLNPAKAQSLVVSSNTRVTKHQGDDTAAKDNRFMAVMNLIKNGTYRTDSDSDRVDQHRGKVDADRMRADADRARAYNGRAKAEVD